MDIILLFLGTFGVAGAIVYALIFIFLHCIVAVGTTVSCVATDIKQNIKRR